MQQVIKQGLIIPESWQLLPKNTLLAELPNSGDLIVPLSLWLEHHRALVSRDGHVGVWLESDESIESLESTLADLPLIALNFPSFTDGRHYSSARILRERYGYTGEIRAIGDVLQDQLFYMKRCGFDAFALRADQNLQTALSAFNTFTVAYQAATDQPLPLFRRR